MTRNDFNTYCQMILNGTLQYIQTTNMPSRNLDRKSIPNGNCIFKTAAASNAPITVVYTPPGSGKTKLLYDRINALQKQGIDKNQILVLSMNIAKANDIKKEKDCQSITFSDFTHNIFLANYPKMEMSDMNSIANLLTISQPDTETQDFISKLRISNPQEKNIMLSLWINTYLQKAITALTSIGKSEYMLESMICQNMMYQFHETPYPQITDILVNGVHNMPIHTLCALLEYANRYHCNLFLTGYPDETIYEFNMAYGGSMDMIAGMQNQTINRIRLTETDMKPEIVNLLNQTRTAHIDRIQMKCLNIEPYQSTESVIQETLTPDKTDYITKKLSEKEQILILARSKSDINNIKTMLEKHYKPLHPDMTVWDMTAEPIHNTSYGRILTEYAAALLSLYPDKITVRQLGENLYTALNNLAEQTQAYREKQNYKTDMDNLMQFIMDHGSVLGSLEQEWNTLDLIKAIIEIESDNARQHMDTLQQRRTIHSMDADILLSTIHSAIDIRCNNVVLIMRCMEKDDEDALYHTALSRANESEYLVFANINKYKNKYQIYLENCI